MPFVASRGAQIWWSEQGRGEPVLLLMGLGCASDLWFRVAPVLAGSHRLLMPDNRGVGRTRAPFAMAHAVRDMAADAAAVIEAAGERSAHVVGFSMGGMIAQQLALDAPQRVRSLTLLGTHPGGLWAVQAQPEVRRLLFSKDRLTHEQGLRAMRPYTYAADTPDERFDEDSAIRLAHQPTRPGYMAQLNALIGWSSYLDLPRLAQPTLVVHGLQDALIPPANGRTLAARIRGARLVELPEASHWLTTDSTPAVLSLIQDHLERWRVAA